MTRAATLATLLVTAGCAGPITATGVSVVLHGAPASSPELARRIAEPIDPHVALRVVELPAPSPAIDPTLAARVAEARRAYLETLEFPACLEALADPELVATALARGDREGAARVVTLRCACHLAAGDEAAAAREAATLGSLGLAVPDLADAVSPRAEALLADALAAAAEGERAAIDVTSSPAGAAVRVDGRAAACETPCRLELPAGAHVLALSLDGHDDARALVHTGAESATITLVPASAPRAAAQWRERHAARPETWASLRLLQIAVPDRRILLVTGSAAGTGLLLRLTLAIDDEPPRAIERRVPASALADGARAALRDLLGDAGLIPPRPIVEEPLFWIAIGAAALLAGGITAAALYQPPVRSPVRLLGAEP